MQLAIAPLEQAVFVTTEPTLLDPLSTGAGNAIGRAQLQEKLPAQPGRGLLDIIEDQPGWIFEANGVLHPRGSEYDTQFVINGVPHTENLSPSFAVPLAAETVESAQVRTAGFPAEYGRSLGGVVDITTGAAHALGWHGDLSASGGSFATADTEARLGFGTGRQQLLLNGGGYRTDRFLDPPVLDNFTNRATGTTATADEQVDLRADKLSLNYQFASLHAMVPNELIQQQVGQRQDRRAQQQSGSLSWQHILSPSLLLTTAGSGSDIEAALSSNFLATPVDVSQNRGFRQAWLHVDIVGHSGHHDWKIGADTILRHVHEQLAYTLTDPSYFDPGTLPSLYFAQQHWDSEPAGFVEDTIHLRNWNISAGLRYDNYAFLLHRESWSPRISFSRYLPAAHLLLHASYDRIFQAPAIENLLLASSSQLDSASTFVRRLPVEPARANFYELGFTQELAGKLRLSGNIFLRSFRNYGDDDTLLNTGVSFPIADAGARIRGEELSVDLPEWRHLLLQVNYANQTGVASGPITGGLFLGDEGAQELATTGRFAVSQDQRNTLRARARWSPLRPLWFGVHAAYNSGLPVELNDPVDLAQLQSEYGNSVIRSINFTRGRVRPWSSIDGATGVQLLRTENRAVLELHVANMFNRLNVLNFASLFSGTAIAPPRAFDARLRFTF